MWIARAGLIEGEARLNIASMWVPRPSRNELRLVQLAKIEVTAKTGLVMNVMLLTPQAKLHEWRFVRRTGGVSRRGGKRPR